MKPLIRIPPATQRLLALALTWLITFYIVFIGGAFDATVRFRVQLLNALAAGSLALLWLVIRWRQKTAVRASGLEWPLIALALSQWLATAASAQPRLSAESTLHLTAWIVACVIVCDLLGRGWPREYLLNALLLVAIVIAAQALWEVAAWYWLWFDLGQVPPVSFRLNGFLGHPNLTSAVINLLLPFVMIQINTRSTIIERGGWALVVMGLLAAEFFTSSRAGWIASGVTLGLTLAFLAWERRTRFRQWLNLWQRWPLVWRIGLGGLALLLLGLAAGLLVRQSQHVSHSGGSNLIDSRRFIWSPAWNVFMEQPLIGRGPDLYAWWYPRFDSVPPAEVLPHPHSLPLHLLSGSGLLGAGAALSVLVVGVIQLWRRWRSSRSQVWLIAGAISLVGMLVHHTFDYFFTSPMFVFLVVMIAALTFAPDPAQPPSLPTHYSPLWLAGPLALMVGFAAFSLRATARHEHGLQLAEQERWSEAALAFQSAAEADPGLTLYWAEAAYAFTRADELARAVPLWQQAHADYPYWAIWEAALAWLQNDAAVMNTLTQTEARSELLALSAGALAEINDQAADAQAAYQQALSRNPKLAEALFWEQTPLRAAALAHWRSSQLPDTSALASGWAAFKTGEAQQAITLFEQARRELPLSNAPYLGLARAYWAVGDEAQAAHYLHLGQNLPVYFIRENLDFLVLEGDWAAAHGNRAAAMEAYAIVFSALDDYTSAGPGTYGYPKPYYLIFRRATLDTDLIPQFVHADITPDILARFVQLARWYLEDQQIEAACYIRQRLQREMARSDHELLPELRCP